MAFADQLKKAREKAGLSIADASKGRGVSPRTWAYWEAGLRLPPAERDAITRERLLASLKDGRPPGPSNVRSQTGAADGQEINSTATSAPCL